MRSFKLLVLFTLISLDLFSGITLKPPVLLFENSSLRIENLNTYDKNNDGSMEILINSRTIDAFPPMRIGNLHELSVDNQGEYQLDTIQERFSSDYEDVGIAGWMWTEYGAYEKTFIGNFDTIPGEDATFIYFDNEYATYTGENFTDVSFELMMLDDTGNFSILYGYEDDATVIDCIDLNQDGFSDCISSTGHLKIRLNSGTSFSTQILDFPGAFSNVSKWSYANLNDNPGIEIIVKSSSALYYVDVFSTSPEYISFLNGAFQQEKFMDLNSDGYDDLVAIDQLGQLGVYENDGTGQMSYLFDLTDVSDISFIETVDIDADGMKDLIVKDYPDNNLYYYQNLGNNTFGAIQLLCFTCDSHELNDYHFTDFDFDGDLDVLRAAEVEDGFFNPVSSVVFHENEYLNFEITYSDCGNTLIEYPVDYFTGITDSLVNYLLTNQNNTFTGQVATDAVSITVESLGMETDGTYDLYLINAQNDTLYQELIELNSGYFFQPEPFESYPIFINLFCEDEYDPIDQPMAFSCTGDTLFGLPDVQFPVDSNTTQISWTFTDSTGNQSSIFQDLFWGDQTAPEIMEPTEFDALYGETVLSPFSGCLNELEIPLVIDNCDGILQPLNLPPSFLWSYFVWEFEDSSGNTVSIAQDLDLNTYHIVDYNYPTVFVADLYGVVYAPLEYPTSYDVCNTVNSEIVGVPDVTFPISEADGIEEINWTFDGQYNNLYMTTLLEFPPANVPEIQLIDGEMRFLQLDSTYSIQWIDCSTGEIVPGETSATFEPSLAGEYAVVITKDGVSFTSDCLTIESLELTQPNVWEYNGQLFTAVTDTAISFNWIDCSTGAYIEGATFEMYEPQTEGDYAVEISHLGNTAVSDCFSFGFIELNQPTVWEYNGQLFTMSVAEGFTLNWVDCSTGQIIPGENDEIFQPQNPGVYAVEIAYMGSTAVSDCFNYSITGIEDQLQSDLIFIAPNPTTGPVEVHFEEIQNSVNLSVYNINGALQFEERFENSAHLNLDFSEFSRGSYFILMEIDGKYFSKKVLIE